MGGITKVTPSVVHAMGAATGLEWLAGALGADSPIAASLDFFAHKLHPNMGLGADPAMGAINRDFVPGGYGGVALGMARADRSSGVRAGLGVSILSTPIGLLSDREARRRNVGGEVICEVW